jgi:hypothetical protein
MVRTSTLTSSGAMQDEQYEMASRLGETGAREPAVLVSAAKKCSTAIRYL